MMTVVSRWVITTDMMERFAELSGDRNPIHVDELASRRTPAGRPVVYGIHTVLLAVQSLVASERIVSPLAGLKVRFVHWAYPGDELSLIVAAGQELDPTRIRVEVCGMCVLTAELRYGSAPSDRQGSELKISPLARRTVPVERSFSDLEICSGHASTPSEAQACAHFPALAEHVTGKAVAEIVACSYIVGMEAPGLYSIYSSFDLTFTNSTHFGPADAALSYRVVGLDERFRKVRISVQGSAICGVLNALMRIPPVEQPAIAAITGRVARGEFAGMHALIVGGSRGLGALTSKIVAAGGGSAIVTYAVGKEEADTVVDEIREWGGQAEALRYSIDDLPSSQLANVLPSISHLFYFATNSIFRPKGQLVSAPILREFTKFYLEGFHDLCTYLLGAGAGNAVAEDCLVAYYPSSTAVDDRPAGMTEYAMAKAAGEQMCRDMDTYLPKLKVLVTRLPRLRTDQTATFIPGHDLDALDVLLPVVRQMQALSNAGCN